MLLVRLRTVDSNQVRPPTQADKMLSSLIADGERKPSMFCKVSAIVRLFLNLLSALCALFDAFNNFCLKL